MKYTFDFNKPILQLNGDPFTQQGTDDIMTCNKFLGELLSKCNSFPDWIKLMEWARTLYDGKLLELDTSDATRLEKIIDENKTMWPIVKEALINAIKDKKKTEE